MGESLLVEKDWSGVHVNRKSKVTTADVGASNGVVHIIDTVLIPVSIANPKPTKNIVQLASGNSDLTTLVSALEAGNLIKPLEGRGPFTVFAPTNEAFAKLPKATLNYLNKNMNLLVEVLKYHVVPGAAVYSKDLKESQTVKTLEGDSLTVDKHWSGVFVNKKSQVTTADVGATNGVVHLINTVLVPPHVNINPCAIDVPKQLQPIYVLEFRALDKDHNGSLDPREFKGMKLTLAQIFEKVRKRGGGKRRLRGGAPSWLDALKNKMRYKGDADRAARVFNKFDADNNHAISLCEYENAMYREKTTDDMFGGGGDGPVVVHG